MKNEQYEIENNGFFAGVNKAVIAFVCTFLITVSVGAVILLGVQPGNTSPEEIYTYIELNMSITDRDCIDYINEVTQNNKINTLQLCTAYPVSGRDDDSGMPDGSKMTYFKDIRPITKLNFSNEILTGNKAIDITYQIYF